MRSLSLLLILCLILESCSFHISDLNRAPSSNSNFEDLKSKFQAFNKKVSGSETDANCSKEDLDRDFNRLMNSLNKDSCSESNFSLDREEFNQRACPKVKTEGVVDKIAKKIIAAERAKVDTGNFKNDIDNDFLNLYKEAQSFSQNLKNVTMNDSIEVDSRLEIIASYVENILLPFRDLIIIKRAYQDKDKNGLEYLNNLLPQLPDSLVRGLSADQVGMITQGPNPSSSPFYLEITQSQNREIYFLNFQASEVIRRDVTTLLKAPTAKNYVTSLKWMTLHMMLSQIYIYDNILGTKAPLTLPNSCQNHFNGDLPASFNFKIEEGAGEQFLENILASHGLTFKQDDTSYIDYYIDNINKDPTKDGYSGMIPFENYKNAKWALTNQSKGALESQFDDVAHFQSVMNLKSNEAASVFRDIAEKRNRATTTKYNIVYSGFDTFQKILTSFNPDEIAEIKLKDGSVKQIYPGKQNISAYLLNIMKQNGLIDYSQLISPRMKQKFANKKVLIDFPSMYSSPVWRDWSLKLLADFFHRYSDLPTNSQLHSILNLVCSNSNNEICKGTNRVQSFDAFLSEFRSGDQYIPTRRLEERKFQSVYPLLSVAWRMIRDNTELLQESKPLELNFLLDQMSAGNPWARLKLSYMIAIDQLEYQKDGIPPVYEFNGLWYNVDDKAKCDTSLIETQYDKLQKAGKILGLDKPLTYNFSSKILSSSEKEYIWKNIVSDFEQKNAQLFSVVSGTKDYYQLTENVSYKTILNSQSALNSGVNLSDRAKNEIGYISKTNVAQVGDFFLKLYSLKGQTEKQRNLFDQFSSINGIDNAFNLKINFLALDEAYKKPIFKDLLRQAALTRKLQIISQLNTFCSMDINNPKEFKNIFYSTTKAQNELNQLAGLPTIPDSVLKKVNEMTPDEFRDMWWGIGSGIAGMAAIIIGGACTAVSGGICAPLGGAMAVAGLSSLGIQVKLTANEFDRKLDADKSEKQIKIMEELGFANLGSHDEVHRSIAWTAFEAISIFPLIGIASKSATLGPKLVYISAQSIFRQTGKTAFKAAAKTLAQEEEVRMARYLIGFESVSSNLGVDSETVDRAAKQIEKIRKLYQLGEIDMESMVKKIAKVLDPIKRAKLAASKTMRAELGAVAVKESKEQIDRQTANVVSNYFGDNPKAFLRVVSSYSGERLERATKTMAEINSPTKIGNGIPIYRNVKDWFLRMRNESLAKNATKILRIEKELQSVPNSPGALNAFILKNIEDITDIFMEIPLRKREIPYVVQVQGMPDFNFINGRKMPLLSLMSEGQTLKKVFQSRARLIYESYKSTARQTLNLKRYVKAETTFEVFKAFQYSIADWASRKSADESAKVIAEYEKLEIKMAQKLFDQYSTSGSKMDFTAFKKLIFNSTNPKDQAMAQVIWESVPADELLNIQEVSDLAHKAVGELSNYSDLNTFERFLSALKVLSINRDPTVLDII